MVSSNPLKKGWAKKLRKCINKYDKDNDGELDNNEFRKFIVDVGITKVTNERKQLCLTTY
jgi:Ca2+-binding EF-hand superfamily protein